MRIHEPFGVGKLLNNKKKKKIRLTAVSSKPVPVELFGQHHRGPAKICAIFVDCLAKCKLLKLVRGVLRPNEGGKRRIGAYDLNCLFIYARRLALLYLTIGAEV